jgi:hypothetical protein
VSKANELTYSFNSDDADKYQYQSSCNVIGEQLCCYWLAEASCLGFGFYGLDFVTK